MTSQISRTEERAQARKVLPLWHPSQPEDSQALTFSFGDPELSDEYAKRTVARQRVETFRQSLPKQGPLKLGTGVRQI